MKFLVTWTDAKLGVRLMAKQPVLSATIVLALATGIGLATMGFTLRDALVNSVLPFAGGDRFVRLNLYEREGGRQALDLARYRWFLEKASTLEHVGAVDGRPFTVAYESGEVESIRGAFITPRSMRLLPASPIVGRTLIPADGTPGAERVVLIRDSFWKRRFNADSALVGRRIEIGGHMHLVIGVMPDALEFPASGEIWLPLDDVTLGGTPERPVAGVTVFAVRRPGASLEAVNVELAELSRQVAVAAGSNLDVRVQARPYTSDSGEVNIAMSALVFTLVLLLLVVASNVATLVLARTWARAPELAVRSALGAGRRRIVGQIFTEVLALGVVAAAMGLGSAQIALDYLAQVIDGEPFWVTFAPSPRIMAFVVFLTLLVSLVSGLWPALRVTRYDLRNTLQAGRGFARGGFGRMGATLLIVEIALSVALLNGAVTMARTFNAMTGEIAGLPHRQVLTANLGRIPSAEMRDKVVAAAAELPGVIAAGAASHLPRLFAQLQPVAIESIGEEPARAPAPISSVAVTNGLLEAIGAKVVSGRLFTAADFLPGAAPVVVVNQPFAQKLLGGRNPVGRRIRVERARSAEGHEAWREIIGVVPDLGMSVGDPSLAPGFYAPVADERLYLLAVRTAGDPLALIAPLRKAVAAVNPDLQLQEFLPLEDVGWDERAFLSGVAAALTAMGGMALLLSIVGIYALLSFMVTRRTREIGIRVALGATSRQVLASVVGGALAYLAIGGVIGSALGLAVIEMRSLILIRMPYPGLWMPLTIFSTLAIAGATACWLPARRALGIRPSEALAAD